MLSHQATRYEWFSPVNIVCGSFSLQAGSAVCGEPPPLGAGDGKLRRQRHHGGAPEQRPGCGVVGQTQVSTSFVCATTSGPQSCDVCRDPPEL